MLRSGYVAAVWIAITASCWGQASQRALNPFQLSPHHATASVANLEAEAAWFERVLGFERSERMGDPKTFLAYHMTITGYRIDLVWQKDSVKHRVVEGAAEQGWLHVVFQSPNVDGAYAALQEKGTDVKAYRDEKSVITRLAFHDPEGNELEIVRQ